jgi:hypothetical protein
MDLLKGAVGSAAGAMPSSITSQIPGAGAAAEALKLGTMKEGDIAAAGTSSIKGFITEGVAIGKWPLFFLSLLFGNVGANLQAGGSLGWAALKAASQFACLFLTRYIGIYAPSWWLFRYGLMISPWILYDILQTLSPTFQTEGYVDPVFLKQIAAKGGVGKFNGMTLGMVLAGIALSGYSVVSWIPPEVMGVTGPLLKTVFLAIGGLVTLAGAGAGGIALLPTLISSLKSSTAETQAAVQGAIAVAASGPVAPPPAPPPAASGAQTGGGGVGSQIPSLREIANGMLGPSDKGDPFPYPPSAKQMGGGPRRQPSTDASVAFFGILGMIFAMGLGLAVVRGPQKSAADVE